MNKRKYITPTITTVGMENTIMIAATDKYSNNKKPYISIDDQKTFSSSTATEEGDGEDATAKNYPDFQL